MIAEASPNIAFIKYWGKKQFSGRDEDRNLALNDSLSMTLSKARTRTEVKRVQGASGTLEVILNGSPASPKDFEKIKNHLNRVAHFANLSVLPALRVQSRNNFPQGTGLASSASAFAALSLAALAELTSFENAEQALRQNPGALSALARRGSGSASRSIEGGFVKWQGSSARQLPLEWNLRDTIVIFSREHKKVPSSEGHELAESSPQMPQRQRELPERMLRVEEALNKKNLQMLGPLLELEALELHQIAATSATPIHYLTPASRRFVEALCAERGRDYFFTLDAGPNVHILSERDVSTDLQAFLTKLGLEAELWKDSCGPGARLSPNEDF